MSDSGNLHARKQVRGFKVTWSGDDFKNHVAYVHKLEDAEILAEALKHSVKVLGVHRTEALEATPTW